MLARQAIADDVARFVQTWLPSRNADVQLLAHSKVAIPVSERAQTHALRDGVEVNVATATDGRFHT